MAKILISSGNGFIGSHLVANLRRSKYQIYILDKNILHYNIKNNFQKKIAKYKKENLISSIKLSMVYLQIKNF
jgi:UDP-glucose 4-epimerase